MSDVIFSSASAKSVGKSVAQYFWEVKRASYMHIFFLATVLCNN